MMFILFFFEAEDGIRDSSVTGVQTCALPIYDPAARRVGTERGCGGAARRAPRPYPRRRLRRAAAAQGRAAAARAGLRPRGLSAALPRRSGPGRRAAAPVCRRSSALRRRPLVGGERPHPDARRRRLCAREPPGDLAAVLCV